MPLSSDPKAESEQAKTENICEDSLKSGMVSEMTGTFSFIR